MRDARTTRSPDWAMALALVPSCLLGASLDELGPRDLPAKAAKVARAARAARDEIHADLSAYAVKHGESRPDAVAALEAIVGTWIPGGGEARASDRAALTEPERAFLSAASDRLAESAEGLLKVELGGAAGFEAYRALGLDPGNAKAAALLGYAPHDGVRRHARHAAQVAAGLQLSAFGWIDAALGPAPGPDLAPHPTGWMPIAEADAHHATWESAHVLSFTFVEIRTPLPLQEVVPWASGLDEFMLWMRARFANVPGYHEPKWPIDLRLYRSAEECLAAGDRAPESFAHWLPDKQHIVMLADSFVAGETMPMEAVARHELAHGFLGLAFPHVDDPKTGLDSAVSGWLTEGFELWVYAFSQERPNDTRFWPLYHLWDDEGANRLSAGEDVVSELVNASYVESRLSPSAGVAGVLADFCLADDLRWEGFARLTAKLHSYSETRDDFRSLVGSPKDVSTALRAWLKQHSPKD